MKPSKELIQAAETVFLAMAYTQTVKPVVLAYQKEILENGNYQYEDKHDRRDKTGRITEPSDAWLMSREQFAEYDKELDKAKAKAGFKLEPGYCPLLVAERLERDTQREMLKAAQYITNIDPSTVYNLKTLNKLEDLTLRFCAPFISSKQVLKTLNF